MATVKFLVRNRSILLYGASLAVLLLIMSWLEWRMIIIDRTLELYAGALAVLFTGLGIWLANQLTRPKTKTVFVPKEIIIEKEVILEKEVIIEKEVIVEARDFVFNQDELSRIGMSKRELEVLQLIADGLSNQQIAERLFVSLNTIKTHSSKVFEKLEVKRRTEAVDKARNLKIIP